jgi:hypothetical protein
MKCRVVVLPEIRARASPSRCIIATSRSRFSTQRFPAQQHWCWRAIDVLKIFDFLHFMVHFVRDKMDAPFEFFLRRLAIREFSFQTWVGECRVQREAESTIDISSSPPREGEREGRGKIATISWCVETKRNPSRQIRLVGGRRERSDRKRRCVCLTGRE